jgi:hypothetical protein
MRRGKGISREFTLPALHQVRRRLSELMEDPEPVMRQLVRVFIEDGTFCPGFQFLPGGQLHPNVVDLFRRAMELNIPRNYFTVWMIPPPGTLPGPASRPSQEQPHSPSPRAGSLQPELTAAGRIG